jgi:sirohydrochlorin cobaltochelatase
MTTGLLLFGHGARDARWREPFDRLRAMVAARYAGPVELAFLELMSPELGAACETLAKAGANRVLVVPLFLGTGGHLRKDLPSLLAGAQARAGVPVASVAAAGEDEAVLTAIADYCLRAAS